MKFTLSWLKKYLDTAADLKTIGEKLTAIGLEVEDVIDNGKALSPFIIAYVESAEQHPNADRLKVCKVNDNNQTYQIVCGAPNARAGMKAVLSLPGMVIPATGEALKKGSIRGVESQGMLCSARELGLGEDADGIIELHETAPIGAPYARTYGLDDPVIEINLTPNRADCAGIYGIARDLAAAGIGKLKDIAAPKISPKFKTTPAVKISTPDCPQFALRLIRGVKNGPSPEWLQKQLRAIGLRPISALVDITNYFTVAHARPMHVFDAGKVKGNLRIESAKGGEVIKALNDKEYTLQPGMTVVCDDSGAISIAGIVGGATTGCSDATTDVLLEVALWNPARITETGRKLQCTSDARYRFERGVDPQSVLPMTDLATQMILELCGGDAGETIVEDQAPDHARKIEFRPSRLKTLGGVDLPQDKIAAILADLGFGVKMTADKWIVTPPSWRGDVAGEADIVEELIRIHGLDNVPAANLPMDKISLGQALNPMQKRISLAKRKLAASGMMELTSFAFVSMNQAELFAKIPSEVVLQNPISSDLNVMRPNILSSLLLAVKSNSDRSMPDLSLFEVGPVYRGIKPEDQTIVAGIIKSGHSPRHWQEKSRAVDAFDAKADVLALLAELGVDAAKAQIAADAPGWYHPGQSGVIKFGPNILAQFGVLHPKILSHYDIKIPVVAAEVFLSATQAKAKPSKARTLLQLSAFQPVSRDFAFVVDDKISAAELVRAVRDAEKQLIADAWVFDVFTGGNLGVGKKSLAVAVTLQPMNKTLTDAEIEAVAQKIIAGVVVATGAVLRG